MFEYIEDWELKEESNKYRFVNLVNTYTSCPDLFDEVYEIPEEHRDKYVNIIIGKVDNLFKVYLLYQYGCTKQLENLISVAACMKLLKAGVKTTRLAEGSFTTTKYSTCIHSETNELGVYDIEGNFVIEPTCVNMVVMGDKFVAIRRCGENTWDIKDLTTGEVILQGIAQVEKITNEILAYKKNVGDYYTVFDVPRNKTCKTTFKYRPIPVIKYVSMYSIDIAEGMMSVVTSDDKVGYLLEANMKVYIDAEPSKEFNMLCRKIETSQNVEIIEVKTGATQVFPLAVAKSLGYTFTLQ